MEKIIARAPELIPRAMAGDPFAIAMLAAAGVFVIANAIKENKTA